MKILHGEDTSVETWPLDAEWDQANLSCDLQE